MKTSTGGNEHTNTIITNKDVYHYIEALGGFGILHDPEYGLAFMVLLRNDYSVEGVKIDRWGHEYAIS